MYARMYVFMYVCTCSWTVTHTRPCHFLHFLSVRLGICEVSVVWGTSIFRALSGGRKFLLFCSRGFALAFLVRGWGWGGGAKWGANNLHVALLLLLLLLNSKLCETAFVSGPGCQHTMLHRSLKNSAADLSNINAFPRPEAGSRLHHDCRSRP